jgi:hypothetical protein
MILDGEKGGLTKKSKHTAIKSTKRSSLALHFFQLRVPHPTYTLQQGTATVCVFCFIYIDTAGAAAATPRRETAAPPRRNIMVSSAAAAPRVESQLMIGEKMQDLVFCGRDMHLACLRTMAWARRGTYFLHITHKQSPHTMNYIAYDKLKACQVDASRGGPVGAGAAAAVSVCVARGRAQKRRRGRRAVWVLLCCGCVVV